MKWRNYLAWMGILISVCKTAGIWSKIWVMNLIRQFMLKRNLTGFHPLNFCPMLFHWSSNFLEQAALSTLRADEDKVWNSLSSCFWDFMVIADNILLQESMEVALHHFISKSLRAAACRASTSVRSMFACYSQ